jgi:hypothetical protein
MANGTRITRSVGFAVIKVNDSFTIDEVVFAEKGDLVFLGARTLEGLALVVDSRKKKLVAAGAVAGCGNGVGGEAETLWGTRLFLDRGAWGARAGFPNPIP